MATYRHHLPQLTDTLLTDGGIETTLIYHDRLELPDFAAFVLLDDAEGHAALERYFDAYLRVATKHDVGIVLETATWRASPDWGSRLGYSPERLAEANRSAVDLLLAARHRWQTPGTPVVISGCIGPRGDGYEVGTQMTVPDAEEYHGFQAGLFAATAVDLLTGITMTYPDEAIGLVRSARLVNMPVAVSFTVETDGRLPSGHGLGEAITQVDEATDGYAAYYMVNCAHPTHFAHVLDGGEHWTQRLAGIRANASPLSHAELDAATELDEGDPSQLADLYRQLRRDHPQLRVLGGCCGTTHEHIDAIGLACLSGVRS